MHCRHRRSDCPFDTACGVTQDRGWHYSSWRARRWYILVEAIDLMRHGSLAEVVIGGLGSDPVALRDINIEIRRETDRRLNIRIENFHFLLRVIERVTQRFRRMKSLQKFALVRATSTTISTQNANLSVNKLSSPAARVGWQSLMVRSTNGVGTAMSSQERKAYNPHHPRHSCPNRIYSAP